MLLEVKNLKTSFPTAGGAIKAVDGVSFTLDQGEILGLVGESGCGKASPCFLLRLVPHPGEISGGEILFAGENILHKSRREMTAMRGRDLAMIFQDPMTSLNPVFRVGEQIRESLRIHNIFGGSSHMGRQRLRREKERVIQLMEEVGIPSPLDRYFEYPHQFSGGMQQRAVIAIALSCEPKILLADEPTTALGDHQAQILSLMERINKAHGMAIILVTHDLGGGRILRPHRRDVCRQNYRAGDDRCDHHRAAAVYPGLLRSIPILSLINRGCSPSAAAYLA